MADFKDLNNTPDTTAEYDPQDITENKLYAILAYIGPLVIVPLLVEQAKKSKFARFHANHGLILLIVEVIARFIGWIIPVIGTLVAFVAGIAALILAVIGIINVCNGKAKELPIIGKYKLLK